MTYTDALYFPYINVENEAWLKQALLYWDKIHTIAPFGQVNLYKTYTQIACSERGILCTFDPARHQHILDETAKLVLEYLNTAEGKQLLYTSDKDQHQISDSHIYIEKLSHRYRDQIIEAIQGNEKQLSRKIYTTRTFADYYMTILASRLAEITNKNPLTDSWRCQRLAASSSIAYFAPVNEAAKASAAMIDVTLENIRIDPETDIDQILRFREKRETDLDSFRSALGKLIGEVRNDLSLTGEFRYRAQTVYRSEVKLEYDKLKRQLNDSRIKWIVDGACKATTFSIPTGSLAALAAATVSPTPGSIPLILGAGAMVLVSSIYMYLERRSIENHKYIYLLHLEREFGHRRSQP